MKKNLLIIIISILVIGLFIGAFFFIRSRGITTITLDINPSLEIKINKNEKVISIKALNEDAKNIIEGDYKGKSLNDTLSLITDNVIKYDYVNDDFSVDIILHSNGYISSSDTLEKLNRVLEEKHIRSNIIVVDKITKEDEELAKKYNISPAKAAYVKEVSNEKENISFDNLIERSVTEINETKNNGWYCDKDYTLEGSRCIKEIEVVAASIGKICPEGYHEYNDKCYEEKPSIETDKLLCREEFTLSNGKCIRTISNNAIPVKYECSKGDAKTRLEMGLTSADAGDANDIVCVDLSSATHPVTPCELPQSDPTERMKSGGRCYWHRAPVIESGCPGKIRVGGECWDNATNILICAGYRDGKQYKSRDEYCEHSIKYYDPVVKEYRCEDDFTLNGNKCEKDEVEEAWNERVCEDGYTIVDNDRCINKNNNVSKVDGYVCEMENFKIKDNMCHVYEVIDAKKG